MRERQVRQVHLLRPIRIHRKNGQRREPGVADRGEQITELRDFSTIEQANVYALMLMQKEGSKPTNAASLLEMEALALEIELQMNDQ